MLAFRHAASRVGAPLLLVTVFAAVAARAAEPPTIDAVLARMAPYAGESSPGVDGGTLKRKVLCGYQGWFTAPGDGSNRGWSHYPNRGRFEPGHCSIDLWPDLAGFDDDEKFPTPFRHADGRPAHVFSSHSSKTVLRHFSWLREHGIDGVFVQRFAVETAAPANLNHCNTVLAHCREGANRNGRAYALMYDLSGLRAGQTSLVVDDWKRLVDRMKLGRDPRDRAYLRENGRPLVAIWGVGFNDGRDYTLDECERLIRFLKRDETYGGCTVMVGVPTGWRTQTRDSVADARLHPVLRQADILSPWTVGRYASPGQVPGHAAACWKPDGAWCRERGLGYLPVIFPGFSWHNMRPDSPHDQIPRHGGRFLWSQAVEAKRAGAESLYVAMFDELDEATAIIPCAADPPVGASRFVTFGNDPPDHYLWLTGQTGRLLRGEIEPNNDPPRRAALR